MNQNYSTPAACELEVLYDRGMFLCIGLLFIALITFLFPSEFLVQINVDGVQHQGLIYFYLFFVICPKAEEDIKRHKKQ